MPPLGPPATATARLLALGWIQPLAIMQERQPCLAIVPYVVQGCADRPGRHDLLGYYAIERGPSELVASLSPGEAGYWMTPRIAAEVVVSTAPCPVRDTTLPLGPALDGRDAQVGWLTDACRRVGDFFNSALRMCVGNSGYDGMLELEERRHREYRREMLESKTEGFSNYTRPEVVHVPAADDEHDATRSVVHRPRIVVEAVIHLRLILGTGAMDRKVPGNIALVRAEAAKYFRERPNMRRKDAAAHLDLVEECFFDDLTHYNTTRWRRRLEQESFLTRLLYSRRHHSGGVA